MAGKFINKSYVNTIDALTKTTVNKVKNANYLFNDKSPVVGNWYNLNKEGTTFDEGTRAEYVSLGSQSPLKFNKIIDAVFYSSGIKIEFDVQYDEEGLGISNMPNIGGIILPNTWIPYSGDYFTFKHAGKEWLYKVNSVSFDTIDNGNNVYKFEAVCDNYGIELIEKQVVCNYRMIVNNVGTSFNVVVKEENYDAIDKLDQILTSLKDYYIALFYNDSVQTFTYEGYYGNLYDPYMIEFMIRNNLLSGSTEYIYVNHEVPVPRTFCIEYNQTYFRALETNSIDLFNNIKCTAPIIDNQYSLFSSVKEDYYMIKNLNKNENGINLFQTLDAELISRVKENNEYDISDEKSYYNIIIKYFNNSPLNSNMIPLIENIQFKSNSKFFYTIPMIIYIIENSVKNLMK
jgi:hypothetical protein